LLSVKQKLKTGFQINPMFTNIWWNSANTIALL
jgi:hypothetical protein